MSPTWLPRLENPTADATRRFPRPNPHRRPLPHGRFQNGTPSLRSPRTGLANRSTVLRSSFTSFAPPQLDPPCRSTLTSTVATMPLASNPHPNNFKQFASSLTKPCPSGTTLSHPICEIIFASTLSRRCRPRDIRETLHRLCQLRVHFIGNRHHIR
jgi:hypothetical protein